MCAGQAAGSVTCGCGSVLSWAAPDEVSRLQWHMPERGLPGESAIRSRWHIAVRSALSKRIKRRDVIDGIMACWAMTAGRIHTAAVDQSRSWRAPPMVEEADSGSWSPDPTAPAPCFGPTSRHAVCDDDTATASDDEITDLPSGMFSGPTDPIYGAPTRRTAAIRTAKGLVNYNLDWDGAEVAADGPCLAAVALLLIARQSADTSRWWTGGPCGGLRMRSALPAELVS